MLIDLIDEKAGFCIGMVRSRTKILIIIVNNALISVSETAVIVSCSR